MVTRSGTGGYGSYPGGGSETIIPIKGTGAIGDPQTVHFEEQLLNFNAATSNHRLWRNTGMWVRIKSIRMMYDTNTSGLVGVQVRPVMLKTDNLGAATQAVPLGNYKIVSVTPLDSLLWEYGPDGVLLWIAQQNTVAGTPTGTLTFQYAGYAATDDVYILVEYEWGELE